MPTEAGIPRAASRPCGRWRLQPIDAHLRLAELDEEAGQSDAAGEVLAKVIAIDRHADAPYQRPMSLQARQNRLYGRPDVAAAATALGSRLDVDVDDATLRLYDALMSPGSG